MKNQRRQAREMALQALFHREFNRDLDLVQCLQNFRSSFKTTKEVWAYSQQLLLGIEKHQFEIDALIDSHSSHWKLERMALVDLSLMRIALYEIFFAEDPVPSKVAINEALEIAKTYSSQDSTAFINGILDQILVEGSVSKE